MRPNPLTPILWESVTQAGFLAGLIATVGHFIGLRGFPFAALYVLLLVVLSITIYNTRTYLRRPSMQFIDGHDKVFNMLATYVRKAEDSIWVTRFSKSSID